MKVYAVLPYYPHEGYGAPEGIFSTEAKARVYIGAKYHPEFLDIFEMELDTA